MTLVLRTLFVLAICVVLALVSGALAPLRLNAAPAPSATSRAGTIPFGGIARTYRLYRPAGHQWPGSEPPPPAAVALLHLDQPAHALDATAVLWDFFASHRL